MIGLAMKPISHIGGRPIVAAKKNTQFGWRFHRSIRGRQRSRETPIIFLTANYKSDTKTLAGQVACGTYQGNADVMWSQTSELLLADVQSADLASLHDWWLNFS